MLPCHDGCCSLTMGLLVLQSKWKARWVILEGGKLTVYKDELEAEPVLELRLRAKVRTAVVTGCVLKWLVGVGGGWEGGCKRLPARAGE